MGVSSSSSTKVVNTDSITALVDQIKQPQKTGQGKTSKTPNFIRFQKRSLLRGVFSGTTSLAASLDGSPIWRENHLGCIEPYLKVGQKTYPSVQDFGHQQYPWLIQSGRQFQNFRIRLVTHFRTNIPWKRKSWYSQVVEAQNWREVWEVGKSLKDFEKLME